MERSHSWQDIHQLIVHQEQKQSIDHPWLSNWTQISVVLQAVTMTGIKILRLDREQDAKLAEPYEQVLV